MDEQHPLGSLPADLRAVVRGRVRALERTVRWVPNHGPQTEAYFCAADLLLYGGQGGGGKSDLLLGLALDRHRRSLLLRRRYADLGALMERATALHGPSSRVTAGLGTGARNRPRLRTRDGRLIEFGAAAHPGDERSWQGHPHDFLGFDEAAQFLESQVRFLLAWNRTHLEGQRCRAVLASNPPLDAAGQWLIGMFRPWLDPTYPKPAQPGELRWFVSDPDGKDVEVPDDRPVAFPGRAPVLPRSRSFLPASLQDNPFLVRTNYQATLDSLPEPLRSAVRDGDFAAARADDAFQLIPTNWILAAQARWRPDGGEGMAMTAMALDPAGGGADAAELAWRHGGWVAPPVSTRGAETADGSIMAGLVARHRRDAAPVVVDVGGGYGGSVMLRLQDNGIPCTGFNGARASTARTRDRQLAFANKRAEAWWRLREALDPHQEGGSAIALPDDAELRADLAAPTWSLTPSGILIEDKARLRARLGRSPDKGDAVAMCVAEGARAAMRVEMASGEGVGRARPQVVGGRPARRR